MAAPTWWNATLDDVHGPREGDDKQAGARHAPPQPSQLEYRRRHGLTLKVAYPARRAVSSAG